MRVLVACEYSGVVRDAFRARGHDAWSCDILPSDADPAHHIQTDCLTILDDGWDLLIAHPPCTYLCNSGVRWLHTQDGRWDKMEAAGEFFQSLLEAPIDKLCVENPIPHKYAKDYMGDYSQIVQPWQFGHPETKATCLWLRGLPLLEPTDVVEGREQRVWKLPPSEDRWKLRSTTYTGIATAMASQWG